MHGTMNVKKKYFHYPFKFQCIPFRVKYSVQLFILFLLDRLSISCFYPPLSDINDHVVPYKIVYAVVSCPWMLLAPSDPFFGFGHPNFDLQN